MKLLSLLLMFYILVVGTAFLELKHVAKPTIRGKSLKPLQMRRDEFTLTLRLPKAFVKIFGARKDVFFTSLSAQLAATSKFIFPGAKKHLIFGMSPELVTLCLFSIPAVALLSVFFKKLSTSLDAGPNPYGDEVKYDVQKANQFFRRRPYLVISRLLKIMYLAFGFNMKLFLDWKLGNAKKNEKHRANDALHLLTAMGPTFVKLGQALSIRTDILSPAYAQAFKKLQDSVTPFNNKLAKKIICHELGIKSLSEKFKTISKKPVASASIGQVYKATLHDGREVAVKVQRPKILSNIGVDLYIMRMITPIQVRVQNILTGVESAPADFEVGYALVDEWGKGLVNEIDYRMEAENTMQFIEAMRHRGLNAVTSPSVVRELSGPRVLVTEWMDGKRLDRDCSSDVPRLCGLALNAYLTMLLDTGVLHCDPHPGNLLRTTDGRLCILDWGMTISLPKDLQYSLLEFISHCSADDYSELAEDFVKLGATPPDMVDRIRHSGITQGFAYIMKQISKGGGPSQLSDQLRQQFKAKYGDISDAELSMKVREEMVNMNIVKESDDLSAINQENSFDVQGVAGVLEMMSKKNRDIFQLPSYMLYIFRAFSTLEGIGLSIDSNYSILNECYPYLAKRLMTDDSPRSRKAMRNMIYEDGRISPNKLLEFTDGFASYTATTSDIDVNGKGQQKADQAIAEILFDRDGNLMQEVMLDSAAQFADSLVRVGLGRIKVSAGGKLAEAALKTPKTLVDLLVPQELRALTLPLTLPYDVSKAVYNLAEINDGDAANLKSFRLLWKNMEPKLRKQVGNIVTARGLRSRFSRNKNKEVTEDIYIPATFTEPADSLSSRIGKPIRRIPVVMKLSRKFGASMFSQVADRFERNKKMENKPRTKRYNRFRKRDKNDDDPINDIDYEIEILLTDTFGSLSSVTAKSLAKVLGGRANIKFDDLE